MTSKVNSKPIFGADDETRDFQHVAITGLQPVKFLSAHSNHQKSHSQHAYLQCLYNLSSSFSSTWGESKFDSCAFLQKYMLSSYINWSDASMYQ